MRGLPRRRMVFYIKSIDLGELQIAGGRRICKNKIWFYSGPIQTSKVELFVVGYKPLTLPWRRPLSYRNQSIDLQSKSMDWFLYDKGLRHERVNFFGKKLQLKYLTDSIRSFLCFVSENFASWSNARNIYPHRLEFPFPGEDVIN